MAQSMPLAIRMKKNIVRVVSCSIMFYRFPEKLIRNWKTLPNLLPDSVNLEKQLVFVFLVICGGKGRLLEPQKNLKKDFFGMSFKRYLVNLGIQKLHTSVSFFCFDDLL